MHNRHGDRVQYGLFSSRLPNLLLNSGLWYVCNIYYFQCHVVIEIVINVLLISIIVSCLPYNFTENERCVDYCFLWMRFIYLFID